MVESKVIAGAAGGGIGGALATFTLWLLGVFVWGASSAADQAEKAVAAVPTPVAGLVLIVLSSVVAFAAGYVAPHTHRPDA
jgi:ABC-type multidrug transport system fused ATPase/permease subunit